MFRPFSRCISSTICLVLLVACPLTALAQQETATITGQGDMLSQAVEKLGFSTAETLAR